MKKRNGQNGKVKEDCVIDDTTGSAIIHFWDELIDQVQNNKSYTFKNLSVKNYSGNTMLGSTASTTFDEVQTELKQVKGPDLLENKDKKVTVKEFKFVDKLNIHFQCQMKSCNKKKTIQHHRKHHYLPIMWCNPKDKGIKESYVCKTLCRCGWH